MHRMFGLMAAAVLATAGCGGSEYRKDAGASPAAAASPAVAYSSPASGISGATSGEFAAEIVSVDSTARTVTLREAAVGGTAATSGAGTGAGGSASTGSTAVGGTTTIRVDGTAGDMLRDFKTGDRVVVSCSMGGSGTAMTGGTMSGATAATGAGGMGTTSAPTGTMASGTLAGCTSVTNIRKAG